MNVATLCQCLTIVLFWMGYSWFNPGLQTIVQIIKYFKSTVRVPIQKASSINKLSDVNPIGHIWDELRTLSQALPNITDGPL